MGVQPPVRPPDQPAVEASPAHTRLAVGREQDRPLAGVEREGDAPYAVRGPKARLFRVAVPRSVQCVNVRAAQRWFADHDAAVVTVVSQGGNRAAQRTYERCGFLNDDTALWFHRWFAGPSGATGTK